MSSMSENPSPDETRDVVWVVYTQGFRDPTDVVAWREDGDTLDNEAAFPYVSVGAIQSALAPKGGPEETANDALVRLMALLEQAR